MVTVDIPAELIQEIMLRLPVKSLLRFRSVCKSWCNLINSQYFIKAHLDHCSDQKEFPKKLIQTTIDCGAGQKYYTRDIGDRFKKPIKINRPFESPLFYTICSSNGLILSFSYERKLLLWNPFTNKFKILPKIYEGVKINLVTDAFGLRYDATNDDYKVVWNINQDSEIWVYSLRFKSWTRFEDAKFLSDYGSFDALVHCSSGLTKSRNYVIAFNFEAKRYRMCKFTENPTTYVLEDKPYMIGGNVLKPNVYFLGDHLLEKTEFFVGEKNGEVINWRKLGGATVSETGISYRARPLCFSEDGSMILHIHKRTLWYDIEKKTAETFQISQTDSLCDSIICRETLVNPCAYDDSSAA